MSQHLPIEETDLFRKYEELCDTIWDLVVDWSPLAQDTVGKQIVRSADSIGANLVEGDGRFSDADSIHFFVIARASARETGWWLRRAKKRKLMEAGVADRLLEELNQATRSLNKLITYRRNRAKSLVAGRPNTKHLTPNTSLDDPNLPV